jgi:hypothetical protein
VVPFIAKVIAPIMAEYGIYRARLPIQKLLNNQEMNKIFIKNAEESEKYFKASLI